MGEPIRKITRRDGTVRYRLVVDIGVDPNGKRQQITRTYDTKREARTELSRIRHEVGAGTYVRPIDQTLAEYLDEYLVGATRGRRASTKATYRNALIWPRERLGHRPLQSITKADIESLVEFMLASGRRSTGTPGTSLSPRTVRLTLGRLRAALETAVREGKLVRNPAALVTPPAYKPTERRTWSEADVRTFLRHAGTHHLHAAWRLSLYGLRRGEVLGLRWSDIDLEAGRLTVNQARTLVDYRVRIEEPKSRNGRRSLPLDETLVTALRKLCDRQEQDRIQAGTAYASGLAELDWYVPGDAYVVTDALGVPVHPEWYSDEFRRLLTRAELPRIRLHDSRHTTLSLMEKAGVPISVISKWAGHHDAAFTMKTYVHATDEDLETGSATLGKLYQLDEQP